MAGYVMPLIEPFFSKARTFTETSRTKFAISIDIGPIAIKRACPREEWVKRQDLWRSERDARLLDAIRVVMNEVLQAASGQADFTAGHIIKRVKTRYPKIGISRAHFDRVAGGEWRELAATLPTAGDATRARILNKLQELVDANIPAAELSLERLRREVGSINNYGPWLTGPIRAARAELTNRQLIADAVPPTGRNTRAIPGGWIDLDCEEWDFKLDRGLVCRNELRGDIAEVVWPLLRDEVRQAERSLSTIYTRFRSYLRIGKLLGSGVKEVRAATLEEVQRAWAAGRGKTKTNISLLRSSLVRLFTRLFVLSEEDLGINRNEMLKIVLWLRTQIKLPSKHSDKDFLTESELDVVLSCCIKDIESGFSFLATKPQLLSLSTLFHAAHNAQSILHLTTALVILTIAFTGLRRRSIIDLEIRDSMRIRPQLSALIWRHPKKGEENIVLTPAAVATLLEHYIYQTNEVRQRLKTNRIFLMGNVYGEWVAIKGHIINSSIVNFIKRHGLTRGGSPLTLTSTTLRRTYATRQLYRGRSIWFVRAQFGHKSIKSTQTYVQLDRYEHPAQVRDALDGWGQRVLTLWDKPVLAENLDPLKRLAVFGDTGSETKAEDSRAETPPCSSCEHLVSGPEYIADWEGERIRREEKLLAMESDLGSAHLVEAERLEFQRFLDNYARIRGGAN